MAGPVLERLDHWAVSWENTASTKLGRILEQNSYDHQAASRDNKELERIVLDAFDKCTTALSARRQEVMVAGGEEEEAGRSQLGGNITSSQAVNDERIDQAEVMMSADERPLVGCEDPNLVESGVSRVFRVGSARTNQAGRDFNIRYCDQETAGGGWTVGGLESCSQSGPLSLVEECRGSSLIGRELP